MATNQHNLAQLIAYWSSDNQQDKIPLSDIYHTQVEFIDPATKIYGLANLQDYLQRLNQNTSYNQFIIEQSTLLDDQAFIVWHMQFQHSRLNNGQLITFAGVTQLRFVDSKIIYHHDYFDLGAMFYEHLPLLGRLIKQLKKRLTK